MQHASVSLPELRLASRAESVEVTIHGSLLLKLPAALGSPCTSADLLDLVTTHQVWIRRVGACHAHVSTAVDGHALLDPGHEASIAQWIEGCEVGTQQDELWQRCCGSS